MNHVYFPDPMLNNTRIKQNNLATCSRNYSLLEDNTESTNIVTLRPLSHCDLVSKTFRLEILPNLKEFPVLQYPS